MIFRCITGDPMVIDVAAVGMRSGTTSASAPWPRSPRSSDIARNCDTTFLFVSDFEGVPRGAALLEGSIALDRQRACHRGSQEVAMAWLDYFQVPVPLPLTHSRPRASMLEWGPWPWALGILVAKCPRHRRDLH